MAQFGDVSGVVAAVFVRGDGRNTGRIFWLALTAIILVTLLGCGGKKYRTVSVPATLTAETVPAVDETDAVEIEAADEASSEESDRAEPSLISMILQTAFSQLGTPYRWGGTSPSTGFDCSGFVSWVFEQHGIELPRSSISQSQVGVEVDRDELQAGDLLFFARRKGSKKVGHVGIYLGDGQFIHSPRRGHPIQETPLGHSFYSKVYLAARRMISGSESALTSADLESARAAAPAKPADGDDPRDAGEEPRYYIVKKGDYIWAIAKRFSVSPFELLKANGLKKESILRIGQRLMIP